MQNNDPLRRANCEPPINPSISDLGSTDNEQESIEYAGQESGNELLRNLENFRNDTKYLDADFIFPVFDRKMKAHKTILAMESTVFQHKFSQYAIGPKYVQHVQRESYEDFEVFIDSFYKQNIRIFDGNI